MIGIEEAYCNVAIDALVLANEALLGSTVKEALEQITLYGKRDTIGLDAMPEIAIASRVTSFDQYAILVTEEKGQDINPLAAKGIGTERGPRTFFVCDPTDRSSQLKAFLEKRKPTELVGDVIRSPDSCQTWEASYGTPASITGAYSAITCVRRGLPICAVLLNYLTQDLVVACSAGIFHAPVPARTNGLRIGVDLSYVFDKGKMVHFTPPKTTHSRKFVTFLGKTGYAPNFMDSKLVSEDTMNQDLHYDLPGGPSRVLYMSELQSSDCPIGFIVANGEKIGEWIHWLPFIRFAKLKYDMGEPALSMYEIFQERPWTRDGILMSTAPAYSIFREVDSKLSRIIIDVDRLQSLSNPSKYRSTLLVTPALNRWALQIVQQYGHRRLVFPD